MYWYKSIITNDKEAAKKQLQEEGYTDFSYREAKDYGKSEYRSGRYFVTGKKEAAE